MDHPTIEPNKENLMEWVYREATIKSETDQPMIALPTGEIIEREGRRGKVIGVEYLGSERPCPDRDKQTLRVKWRVMVQWEAEA